MSGRKGRFTPPEQSPLTDYEIAQDAKLRGLIADLADIADRQQQDNLDAAVLLAQMAARHQGDLVDHFAKLGQRFGYLLNQPKKSRPKLRLVGGAS